LIIPTSALLFRLVHKAGLSRLFTQYLAAYPRVVSSKTFPDTGFQFAAGGTTSPIHISITSDLHFMHTRHILILCFYNFYGPNPSIENLTIII
jgi:hypothetical protein